MTCLLISAIHKSSGKTMLALGLAAAFRRQGRAVQTFKKGPDYIDAMWLGRAAGRPCRNLDFHTMSGSEIEATFACHAAAAEVAIVEGNKGLFDGVDVAGSDSNAALAELLGTPVVLIVDARGMTRGIAPLVKGYQSFGPSLRFAGVILNQVGGPRHEGKLRAALERYTEIPVLGAIGRHPEVEIAERHLGLIPTNEARGIDDTIARIADIVECDVDLAGIGAVARMAAHARVAPASQPLRRVPGVRIAVAQDAAFGFYYPDDLEALARAGAELVAFDTLRDARLPAADGLFIGGGFPETQAAALEANGALRHEIGAALGAGMPAYVECGGLLYLCRSLETERGRYRMVGFLPGDAVMHRRPVGRGYVKLKESARMPWPGSAAGRVLPAHEFHYAALANLPEGESYAYEVVRGHGIDGRNDGLVRGNTLATFAHQRDVAANRWAERFVAFVSSRRQGRGADVVEAAEAGR
jgi:cobyrinic acid a,c-diamide synthase